MMLRVKILRTQAGAEKQWGVIKAQDFPSQQQVYEVNYTLALAMGACYLPLQGLSQYCCSSTRIKSVLLQLLVFNIP